ncbi:glycosyl hydrolase family 95 catalytic domain-containing protein [Streptosporangium sp. DT93]|uniref:glycoside hydrolase family 95 protein n=1 Tax=Streptosporangium sp. DT93 TaxID=3393428 RepID=UPI003CF5909B
MTTPQSPDPTLRYDAPATDWETQALPIGNGALGAMVFGGVGRERIQFNEKSLWTGGPGSEGHDHGNRARPRPGALAEVRARIDAEGRMSPEAVAALLGQPRRGYGAYQPFGDLWLDLPELPEASGVGGVAGGGTGTAGVSGYRRELDLGEAVARVGYTAGGVGHLREYFASHPGDVVVGRISADRPGRVSFTLRMSCPHPGGRVTVSAGRLTLRGALADNRMRFEAQVQVVACGGTRADGAGHVTVEGADSAVFVLSAGTDYADVHPGYRGDDPRARVTATVDEAAGTSYERLRAAHRADHRELFDRVVLTLGRRAPAAPEDPDPAIEAASVVPVVPTDRLRAAYTGGPSAADRALEALFFAYGRYLLIASSRRGSLPANLQGVWNDSTTPPWSADYHVNINLQMNYWLAEQTGLAETAEPYDRFVASLVAPGRESARRMFGVRGWVVHDETTPFGFTGVHDWPTAFWFPEAAAWLTRRLYEHYLFGGDLSYLREAAYPVMREAAVFWLDTLHVDPRDGTLVASPSYSPEHGDFSAGAAMSQQIVFDVLTNTLEAARTLGDDPAFRAELADALARLDPGVRIGSWGQLQEWKDDWDDPGDTHRHLSHLYALHPGSQVTAGTPEAEAARVSLVARGDGGTGWSKAWKIGFWARLLDGDHAHLTLAGQLRDSTLDNLWDTHPPFQIDGNLGAVAGMAEMLLQSAHGTVHVLPALPAAWPDGSVTGLRARGGVTVDVSWTGGAATRIVLRAGATGPIRVRAAMIAGPHRVRDAAGGTPGTTRAEDVLVVDARAGETYIVTAGESRAVTAGAHRVDGSPAA